MLLLATLCLAFAVYCVRCAVGRAPDVGEVKHNQLFGPFFARFLVWLIGPLERLLIGRVSPNALTLASLVLCGITGAAVALGHLPGAMWLYVFAGVLDVLDGRIARLSNQQTPAGALLDSVSDRWGELLVFAGYLWLLQDSPWLVAVMSAIGGSMMVSYTRARAEGLGVALSGGLMQRAERIALVASGSLLAAWCGGDADTATLVAPILGITMSICGVASTATAISRWVVAYRELVRRSQRRAPEAIASMLAPPSPAPPSVVPSRVLLPSHVRSVAPLEQH
ncbi:MAG: CDP-alcohol phosphatidyltransferase family protein [Deltaproteobacteria bacterium]|nr:MAG: CDP-alcohol phosphatidyltransferase family protein [Deltaproteobacteria bacterium]